MESVINIIRFRTGECHQKPKATGQESKFFHINVFKISTDSLCIFTKSYNYSFKAKQYVENRTVTSFRKYTVFTSYTRTERKKFHIESICKSLNISIDRKIFLSMLPTTSRNGYSTNRIFTQNLKMIIVSELQTK